MKVAISVPDPTFEEAEQISKRLGLTRSGLYTRAIEEFVKVHRDADVCEALAAVYGSEPATESAVDPLIDQLQSAALREEW